MENSITIKMLALLTSALLLLMDCGGTVERSYSQVANDRQIENSQEKVVTSALQAAINTAKDDARKTYGPLDGYNVVSCEHPMFWLIFFDPQGDQFDGMGLDYAISKVTGQIVEERKIRLAPPIAERPKSTPISRGISREQAIAIAKRDFDSYGGSASMHDLTTCELSKAWRIVYSPRVGLSGGGPEYVLDKMTGKFLERRYTQ